MKVPFDIQISRVSVTYNKLNQTSWRRWSLKKSESLESNKLVKSRLNRYRQSMANKNRFEYQFHTLRCFLNNFAVDHRRYSVSDLAAVICI